MNLQQILQLLQSLGGFGIPSSNTLGALAGIALKWIQEEKARGNMSDAELATHAITVGTQNELQLLVDKARLEEELTQEVTEETAKGNLDPNASTEI